MLSIWEPEKESHLAQLSQVSQAKKKKKARKKSHQVVAMIWFDGVVETA